MLESNDPEVFRLGIQSLPEDFYDWLKNPDTMIVSPITGYTNHGIIYLPIFESALNCNEMSFSICSGLKAVYMYFSNHHSMVYILTFISVIQQYENFRSNH